MNDPFVVCVAFYEIFGPSLPLVLEWLLMAFLTQVVLVFWHMAMITQKPL